MDLWVAIKGTLLVVTFGFAVTVFAYAGVANRTGGRTGEWFRDHTLFLYILAGLAMPFSVGAAVIYVSWTAAIIVLVGGGFLGSIATVCPTPPGRFEVVAFVGLVICWMLDILFVIL